MFIVKTSSAKMPGNCWGTYRRVVVMETDGTQFPKMISDRAKGVVHIVHTWEKLHVGKTEKCAYAIALSEAYKMADELNSRGL